jgi:chromosomal replication initiator protein
VITLAIVLDEGMWPDPVLIARQSLEKMFGTVRITDLSTVQAPAYVPPKIDPTVREVTELVAFEMGLSAEELIGDSRERRIARGRFAAVWLASTVCGRSLMGIGRALNGRDHSTIRNAISRAIEMRDSDPAFRQVTDKLATAIRGRHA